MDISNSMAQLLILQMRKTSPDKKKDLLELIAKQGYVNALSF